ncbi:MAG: DnaA regulatory inactivator Hda [Pseudomonadota bacterium]
MAMPEAQLGLPVQLRDDATLDNFYFSSRLLPLRQLLEAPGAEQSLYVHGPTGSGRSHLLQAACHARESGAALYLPLTQLAGLAPGPVLEGVESLAMVCLDNLQSVLGRRDWEEALFHLINRARETGCQLLMAADAAPAQLDIELADLASRLAWSTVFQLRQPGDVDKCDILKFRAARRGIVLDSDAARYILSRAPRGMADLMALLEKLDRDSLAKQRSLTIPFIKQSLGW